MNPKHLQNTWILLGAQASTQFWEPEGLIVTPPAAAHRSLPALENMFFVSWFLIARCLWNRCWGTQPCSPLPPNALLIKLRGSNYSRYGGEIPALDFSEGRSCYKSPCNQSSLQLLHSQPQICREHKPAFYFFLFGVDLGTAHGWQVWTVLACLPKVFEIPVIVVMTLSF